MGSRSPRRFAGALFLMVLLASSPLAFAHAVLVSSTPGKNDVVHGSDIAISLKYNSRIDGARSTLSLVKPDGTVEKIGTPGQEAPDTVTAGVHGLTKGAYVLRWQVLAHDGHITRGEIPFKVE